jgi:hypothetical protein
VAKNKITDLRDHLFETIEALKDPDKPMDLDRARAISDVAQTIINAAKVEVDLVKAVNGSAPGSASFFNLPNETRELSRPAWAKEPRQISGSARAREEA